MRCGSSGPGVRRERCQPPTPQLSPRHASSLSLLLSASQRHMGIAHTFVVLEFDERDERSALARQCLLETAAKSQFGLTNDRLTDRARPGLFVQAFQM